MQTGPRPRFLLSLALQNAQNKALIFAAASAAVGEESGLIQRDDVTIAAFK